MPHELAREGSRPARELEDVTYRPQPVDDRLGHLGRHAAVGLAVGRFGLVPVVGRAKVVVRLLRQKERRNRIAGSLTSHTRARYREGLDPDANFARRAGVAQAAGRAEPAAGSGGEAVEIPTP